MAKGPVEQHLEVERKYDVDAVAAVPDLSGLPGVARVVPAERLDQLATYVDTADLALLAARVTLRRRVGGVDDGWHLKLPAGEARTELHHLIADPDDADEPVPAPLRDRVRTIVGDRPLVVSAQLRTLRAVHRLLDVDGRVLAELCDDRVEARTGPGWVERWREWELELVDGPPELLDLAGPMLLAAGARPSASPSKLARALAGRPGPDATTADVLRAYLTVQVQRLQAEDGRLRSGDQEGVHQMRIAARRMRSALASYAPVLEDHADRELREELRWLGEVLAPARDAQVIRQRLLDQVGAQPDVLVLGPISRRVDDELGAALRAGRAAAVEELDRERYHRLLGRLESLVSDVPVREAGRRRAAEMVPRLLRRDLRRVRRRHRAYLGTAGAEERDRALHDVRKAAKRLRYAAESATPVLGDRAATLSAAAKAVQDVLGEHQDTVVARRVLRDLALHADAEGENGFTFGRLHALEERRAAELAARYPQTYDVLPTARALRSWLRG